MAYTYSDLKNRLKTEIGDANLNTTLAGDALNHTQQEIFNKFELTINSNYQSNTVAAGANTLTTPLPTGLQRITAIYVTTSGRESDLTPYYLAPKEFRSNFPSVTVINPLQYWTFFTEVEFSTLADAETALRIEYIDTVTNMSGDSDVPTVPEAYEELLMLGAKIRIYEQKEDFDYANQFLQRYGDLQEAFVSRYSTRQVDAQYAIPGSRDQRGFRTR
jgi:hypothetical protein